MASSRVQIAEFASVSRQAVHKALRRGWLAAEADGRIESHDRFWPIASFRCAAEFGRYRGIADSDKPSTRQIYGFTA
jgi:hypothetical protein